jgi:hypothetical protein
MREFYALLGLEMAIAEVESRINATAAHLDGRDGKDR